MRKIYYAILFGLCILMSCRENEILGEKFDASPETFNAGDSQVAFASAIQLPLDGNATQETKNLYMNMQILAQKGVMFGHEDDMATGLTNGILWRYIAGRSDVKEVGGSYPAVFGSTLGQLEVDSVHNLAWIPFWRITQYTRNVYDMGAISNFAWHPNNPVEPIRVCNDLTVDSTIKKMFADPVILARYKTWLDKVATYVTAQKGPNGELIPLIFRPFLEFNGYWFWWGSTHCTAQEYIDLWRLTVDYLRVTKGVHNLLYEFCPDQFYSRTEYLERYPGDDYVDILSFDSYDKHPGTGSTFLTQTTNMVATLRQIALEKDKPYAIAETGAKLVPFADWWTQTLLPVLKNSGLSYALIWHNNSPTNYWGPYIGHPSAPDFVNFAADSALIFQNKLVSEHMYQAPPPLLKQNFNSSATLSSYINANPDNTRFTSIGSTGSGTVASINTSALRFDRTANADYGYFSRTKDFSSIPPIVQYKFDISVSANTSGSTQSKVAVFQMGSGYVTGNNAITGTPLENNALTHSCFAISFGATPGQFAVRDIGLAINSSFFSGTQTITWVVNNSGKVISYTAPNGSVEALGIDRADLWVGNTKAFNEIFALTASQKLSDLKFAFLSGTGILNIDNMMISRL
jgi:mannan endo-1,4-beta-mannosidase